MIDPLEGVTQTQPGNQPATAAETSQRRKPQTKSTDAIQISDAARAALHENSETHAETDIKAKCGNLEAQRLLLQEAAKRKLLGLD